MSLKEYNPTDFSIKIFKDRYAIHQDETFKEACLRIANFIASAEDGEKIKHFGERFFEILNQNRFSPGGRIWRGSGRKRAACMNCFLLPSEDSREGWGELIKEVTVISGLGGGIGISFDNIRPRGTEIKGTGGIATGSVSLMKIINGVCNELREGGGRRSALLFGLSYWHPDIEEFLSVKLDKHELNNANISVLVDDKFFDLVESDGDIELKWQDKTIKTIKAKWLYDKVIENSLKTGDPGFLNIGLAREMNNLYWCREITCSNPCGEQQLPPYSVCCLGAVVLPTHVDKDGEIDFSLLDDTVRLAVRFLDNVIDKNEYPLQIIKDWSQKERRIGLGVMGLHDMLLKMNVKYSSDKALKIVDEVMSFIKKRAYEASIFLSVEKNQFPLLDRHKFVESGFCKKSLTPSLRKKILEYGLRNSFLLTIAPTGCQKEDTLVITNKGILRLNELIDKNGSKWQQLDNVFVTQEKNHYKADMGFVNGLSRTKKITLSSGIIIETTPNHQIRIVKDGKYLWERADQLKMGDIVPVRIGGYSNNQFVELNTTRYISAADFNLNKIKYPKYLSNDLAWFLGLFYGDGSVHKRGIRIHCNENDTYVHNILLEIMYKEFRIRPTIEKGKGKLLSFCYNSIELLHFLNQNGLLKTKAHLVSIPLKIRQSPPEIIESFIDGYWYADGSLSGNNKNIVTTSLSMSQDLAICLRAIGQNCRVEVDNARVDSFGKRPLYRIWFVGHGSRDFNQWKPIRKFIKNQIKEIQSLISKEFVYDTITNIENSTNETLDISVPENECYLAASIISHNTTSIVAECSSGIEPMFAPVYRRNFNQHKDFQSKMTNQSNEVVIHPLLKEFIENNKNYSHFEGAHDISPEQHCKMQVICQKHLDNATSKTINLPKQTTEKELSDIILNHIRDLKGMTIYVDGSKGLSPIEILSLEEAKEYLNENITRTEVLSIDCPKGVCEV